MKKLSSFLVDIAASLFALCVILAVAAVFCRKVLNNSLIWAEEVIRYTFIWLFFLAMPEITRCGGHFALDLLPNKLEGNVRRALLVIIEGLCALLDAVIVYYGTRISLMNMTQYSASLRIPYGYIYFAIPVGAALMMAFSIRRMILFVKGREETE